MNGTICLTLVSATLTFVILARAAWVVLTTATEDTSEVTIQDDPRPADARWVYLSDDWMKE